MPPVAAAVAAAAGFVFGGGSILAGIAQVALGAGLSLLSSVFTKKPKALTGSSTDVEIGADIPRRIIFGRAATAGRFVYWKGEGDNNRKVHLVFALADWECEALEYVWIDGVGYDLDPVSVVGSEHARFEISEFAGKIVIKFFRGTMGQSADSELVTASGQPGGGMGSWTSNHRGAGVCYVSIILTFDEDGDTPLTQIPNFLFQVKGARLYDPRLDTTAGGSGPHRWNDPTTWEWTGNPAICDYNFRRGFFRNGQRLLGMGVPATDLLLDHYFAAANICDEVVTEGGNDEARYTCGVIVPDDAEWRVACESFRQAMAGEVYEKQGQFGVIAGAAQSSVATLTDADLLLDFDSQFSAKLSRSELANAVYTRYLNPNIRWESDTLPPLHDATAESEDNGERLPIDLELSSVYKPRQANRIAKIALRQARKQATHTGVYGPKFNKIEPGDWVTLTNRFGTFTMRVTSREEVARQCFRLSMRETASSVYGGAADTITPTPPPIVTIPPHAATLTGLAAVAVVIQSGTQARPGIQITWNAPTDPNVTAAVIEYRKQGTTDATRLVFPRAAENTVLLQQDILADTVYEIRGTVQVRRPRPTSWTSWINVTTSSDYIVATSVFAHETMAELNRLATDVQELFANAIYLPANDLVTTEELKQLLLTEAYRIRDVANDTQASLVSEIRLRADGDSALASQITAVEARSNAGTATGAYKLEAISAPSGVAARFAVYLRVDQNASTYAEAGFFIDLVAKPSGGGYTSRAVFAVDRFAIVTDANSGAASVPFAIIGGIVYMNATRIGSFIESSNFEVDGNNVVKTGWRIDSSGLAQFVDLQVLGATIARRPLITSAPTIRNGVVDTTYREYVYSADYNYINQFPTAGGPTNILVDITRNPDQVSGLFQIVSGSDTWLGRVAWIAPPGSLLPSIMAAYRSGSDFTYEFRSDGKWYLVQRDSNGALSNEYTNPAQWAFDVEIDPTNSRGASKVWCGLGIARRPFPWIVPQGTTSLAFKCWGAGGGSSGGSGIGGPGGYVAGTFAVGGSSIIQPGDCLWLIAGQGGRQTMSANSLGFGGAGQGQGLRPSGGGGTFVFLHTIARSAVLLAAGGGGSGIGSLGGGPGGYTGTNGAGGQTGTNIARMTGRDYARSGGVNRGAGGGGYEGGISLPTTSGSAPGAGGTNFIHADATSTTDSSAGSPDSNGYATTRNPPQNSNADKVGNDACLFSQATVGQGHSNGAGQDGAEGGGNGLIVITIS